MYPFTGFSKPQITFAIVDFPLPDKPVMAIILEAEKLISIFDLKLPRLDSYFIRLFSINLYYP